MKRTRYFTIPQTPADYEQLWRSAEPLDRTNPPPWVGDADPALYRHIGLAAWREGATLADYQAQVTEIRNAGVIFDPGTPDHPVDHFYLMDPEQAWFNEAVWAISIYSGDSPHRLSPAAGAVNPVITRDSVTDVPAAFVADPFMIRSGGQWFMFFEVMNASTGKGDIGLATSRDALHWNYQHIVLCEPFHLSYPHVFEWEGSMFMIPETHQAGAVRLYKADPFPQRWSFVAELLSAPYLADPSIFRHAGKWWMFADVSTDLANDTLGLYHANNLTGPWVEHEKSPIIQSNTNTARPGGRVINHLGRPIRFAQGCVPYYGTNVRAFEIIELTPTTYQEREVAAGPILGPTGSGWNACGMHHLDAHFFHDRWIASVDGWRSETLLRQP